MLPTTRPLMSGRRRLFSFAATACFLGMLGAFGGCTSILGEFELLSTSVPEGGSSDAGRMNGEPCQAAAECASGFCVDGVCCESACSGTCESCALTDKGRCAPIPDGTDPEQECLPAPRADAGATGPIRDGGSDASGTAINVPDGGLESNDAVCAGACNGLRQCRFPNTETTCGSKFCNTPAEAARYACNGQGRCELGFATCVAFACENDGCRTGCAAQDDCNTATHFCNPQGICQEKLDNGVSCVLPTDCHSGFCVGTPGAKVCCNADCDQITGGSCTTSASIGSCKCKLECGTGSCRLYYRDSDVDGFGDKFGTVANGNAVLGCDNAPPPSGFVADRTDCADNDPRAKPGQTQWFDTPINDTASFDFNCNGSTEKELDEFPGARCTYCEKDSKDSCIETTKCSALGQPAYLSCAPAKTLCTFGGTCIVCGGPPKAAYNDGFASAIACGNFGSYTTCGSSADKACTISGTTSTSKQQRCH